MPDQISLPDDLPGHLGALNNDDLATFETTLITEAGSLVDTSSTDTERLTAVDAAFAVLDTEKANRAKTVERRASLATRVQASQTPTDVVEPSAVAVAAPAEPASPTETVVASVPRGGAIVEDIRAPRRLNPSLADAQRHAPALPERNSEAFLIASSDIPNVAQGARINGMLELAEAMIGRARGAAVQRLGDAATRIPIASVQRNFRWTLNPTSHPSEINEVLTAATNPDALVAAGGWCSPSEITYDFFNIASADGMLDLPTVGISRGGIRYPVSPSYADVVDGFTGSNLPLWSWTETQDIAALTGTGQSGTKTCGRVPCAEFVDARLECDGLCLTVGNLTEASYPELIANYTDLLFKAHAHKMNAKRITKLVDLSTVSATTTGTGFTTGGQGVVAPVIGAVSLAAIDYRDRYAMADNAVLEVVLPRWIRSMMRSDLRKRTGVDLLEVADARIMRMFDAESVRVQWVNDWQVRGTGYPGNSTASTGWPTTVSFMIYAPGTFFLGEGLRLDLGIIRDSVLNATNDHTAAWMEECWLIGMPGHQSRLYTVAICADGTTGAADLATCGL